MDSDLFDKLSTKEREELELCGIKSPQQLQNTTADKIIRELKQAKRFFPEKEFSLTEQQLRALFTEIKSESDVPTEQSDVTLPGLRSSMPTTGYRHRTEKADTSRNNTNTVPGNIMHSPVRCTHPFTAILAAFFTLFLIIPLASIVVLPVLMVTEKMPDIPVEVLATLVLGIPCLVYVFIARRATCPVCHMRIFRFSHYTRNRAAHHLPILGYNFTTALHLLFFWKYNCPGCGTPVKLTGSKGHRTHC